jgi:predicted enzyme related to lactoylglutathione lyase
MRIAASLPAHDLERARAWYKQVLQVEPARELDSGSLWYEIGGADVVVYASQFAGTNQATALMIGVDDVEEAVEAYRSRGAAFEDYDLEDFRTVDGILTGPDGSKLAWMKDSEGNILGIGAL